MSNSANKKLLSQRIGMVVGGVWGILYLSYVVLESGMNMFNTRIPLQTILENILWFLSIILGSILSGFFIDKDIIHRLVPANRYLESHKIGSVVLCSAGGILFFLPAVILGGYLGGGIGGFIGSGFGGRGIGYGVLIGMLVGTTFFIIIITIIGALLGAFLGAFMESLIRVFLRVGKVVK